MNAMGGSAELNLLQGSREYPIYLEKKMKEKNKKKEDKKSGRFKK